MEAWQVGWLWTQNFDHFVSDVIVLDLLSKVDRLFVLFVHLVLLVTFENELSQSFCSIEL